MQGKISAISQKEKYVSIKVNDQWFSAWKDKLGSYQPSKDDVVEFEFTTNDKGYNNITKIKKVGGNNQQTDDFQKIKQDQIRRESVLKVAADIEIHNSQLGNKRIDLDNVIAIAKFLSRFVMGHDPTALPPEPQEPDIPDGPAQEERY